MTYYACMTKYCKSSIRRSGICLYLKIGYCGTCATLLKKVSEEWILEVNKRQKKFEETEQKSMELYNYIIA